MMAVICFEQVFGIVILMMLPTKFSQVDIEKILSVDNS